MVIDGLDETEYQGRNELLDVIANQFFRLPQWIRFFVTTRPEINIADSLKQLQPIQLDENQEENLRDIRLFFEMRLSCKIEEENKDVLWRKLVEKSEGVFLYAYFLMDYIQENVSLLTLEQLESGLPLGISSVYLSHFKRLENELSKELKVDEDQVLGFLCAFTASREPLPVAFVFRLLNPSGRSSLSAQRRMYKAIACISSLLPVRNDCLHFFHKSVKDWLTNISCYGRHDFTVNEKKGHEILFNLCRDELDNVKQKGVYDTLFSDPERYALQHGVQHMIEMDESGETSRLFYVEELVNAYVADLELVYAKLCVNSTACSEEMISVQRHIKPTLLSDQSQSLIISLFKILRKYFYLLIDHPHLWFQSVINEGSPELSSKAATILENRLPNVPYIRYLDKEEQNGAVQARFYCSDTVACFDVSPEMDYMVCECRDGTIHMWSLETGNKEWVRPSLIERTYSVLHPYGDIVGDGGAYRGIAGRCLTFYRSVVFHPSGKSVLPGTLRRVYTLKGECNDLFPDSNCTFSHCTFACDKRIILTDCFDDPKKVVLWSMENGQELRIMPWNDVISSFAISQDGLQIAWGDVTGSVYRVDVNTSVGQCMFQCKHAACGLMHFTPDNREIVCGYFCCQVEDLGCRQYGWVPNYCNQPLFILCRPGHLPKIEFVLWPIQPGRTLARKDFFDEGFHANWVNNVRSVFPSLHAGFCKKLNSEITLVGSPSFKYLALVKVDSLNEVNSGSTNQMVEKVVFSSEGDVIYSISSKRDQVGTGAVNVTVFRMSSQEILVKKPFTCTSLSLVPMKEGVLLCFQHRVAELWNFELTECIRQIPRLKGTEKLIRLSDELIACEWYCRTLTQEEKSDLGSSGDEMELHEEDDSGEQDESAHFDNSPDEEDSLLSDDPSVLDISGDLSNTFRFCYLFHGMTLELFRMLVVDVVNITSGECVSSFKTRVSDKDDVVFVSCLNSREQLLVCTTEEIDDDFFADVERLTVSLRNSKSRVWERCTKRYDSHQFAPHFMFSSEDSLLVTWGSLYSGYGVHILDARTGETLHTLLKDDGDITDCKFVVNDESVVCCSNDNFLRLFNIRSGDLLSVLDIEEHPHCLGACLSKPLVAIGLMGARLKFVHVKLPGVQEAEGKKGEKLWLDVNSSE